MHLLVSYMLLVDNIGLRNWGGGGYVSYLFNTEFSNIITDKSDDDYLGISYSA